MFTLKDGSVSAYGLACGHIDVKTRTTETNKEVEIRLSHNGATYDVDVIIPGEQREWLEPVNGPKIISGWAQFDKLTDARKFQRKLVTSPSIQTTGDMFALCLLTHYYD